MEELNGSKRDSVSFRSWEYFQSSIFSPISTFQCPGFHVFQSVASFSHKARQWVHNFSSSGILWSKTWFLIHSSVIHYSMKTLIISIWIEQRNLNFETLILFLKFCSTTRLILSFLYFLFFSYFYSNEWNWSSLSRIQLFATP